jgi:hypothetical protein
MGCSSSTNGGGSSTAPQTLASFGQKFELTNTDVAGWTSETAATGVPYQTWLGSDYVTQVDGTAAKYTDQGAEFVAQQYMDGPNQAQCIILSMDFGTEANAQAMFNVSTKGYLDAGLSLTPIESWPQTSVSAYGTDYTLTVYATFGQYYFEIALDGTLAYPASFATGCAGNGTACADLNNFITVCKAKTT